MELVHFNAADAADAASVVTVWAAVPRWVEQIVERRPYSSVDELAEVAGALAAQWTVTDLDTAVAHHARIGQRPHGESAEATASRTEQAAMSSATDADTAAIAAGNAAYEEHFGRVFLIRAAGRSPQEMRSELERRLRNDATSEAREALDQLAQIALLRLQSSIQESAGAPT